MPETPKQRLTRLLAERKKRRASRKGLLARAMALEARIVRLTAGIKQTREKLRGGLIPGIQNGWHVKAIKNQVQGGIGAYLNVPAKLVWHTTEGTSLPGYAGSHPHFTLDFKRKQLYQHIPVTSGAMALVHGVVETNRAHAIQVELVGFASESPNWSDADYAQIAALARWIEKHCGVPRKCTVRFVPVGQTNHLGSSQWLSYSGHLGHQHVPGNDHTDPGSFQIQKVI